MNLQNICRIVAGFALLVCASSALAALAPAPALVADGEGDVLVRVIVVDEVTGAPLPGWDIRIGPRGPEEYWYTGITGNGGSALFLLPQGEYRAWVSRGAAPVWDKAFSATDDVIVVVAVNPYEDD